MRPAAVPFLAARLLVGAAFAAPAAAQDAAPERPVAEPAAVT
ncbi:ABC transporter substrate-binding protein, partial [Methylobacterium sp. IIF4SW-B5]|nr:ABC transporter substrate-binding protein [Methylobacterium ajmalii]